MSKELNVKIPFGRVLTTANAVVTESGITTKTLDDIQEVVAVGPFVKLENGTDIKVGDNILIDTSVLEKNPKAQLGLTLGFNKETGEIAKPTDKKEDIDLYQLFESRQLLVIFPKK
jgi:hypothetical protein